MRRKHKRPRNYYLSKLLKGSYYKRQKKTNENGKTSNCSKTFLLSIYWCAWIYNDVVWN